MTAPAAQASRGQAWLLASRPATLPAAAVPVIVGTAVAVNQGADIRPLVFLATLVAALLIQIGTNFANDYSDFHRGADNENRLGPVRVTQSGLISASDVRRGIIIALGLALIPGAWLAWVGGWPILLIGVLSIISGLAYTGGPWPLGYHGLGDLFVFIFFGIVAVTGTAFLQLGEWSALALILAIPIGLLITNILVVNNLRDLPTDRAAGKRTLAVGLGDRATRMQYIFLMAFAFGVPAALALTAERHRWLLLSWLAVPLAIALARRIVGGTSGRDLNPMLGRSGQLVVLFGLLLSAGLWLGRPH